MKKFFYLVVFFLLCANCFSQENYSVAKLLEGYLENDLELKKLLLSSEIAKLDLEQTKLDQGFDISISTGTMTFYPGNENTGASISVKPSLTAQIPSLNNFKASVSGDYKYDQDLKQSELVDGKLAFGIDVISQEDILSKIAIEKSSRALLEAKRNLKTQILMAEKKFYTELKAILNLTNNILTYRQDFYTDKLNLEKLKAQGYSEASSTYRIAQMKVSSGAHNIEVAFHNLKRDIVIFYSHCGINIEINDNVELMSFVPNEIIDVDPLIFSNFEKEKFSLLEKAMWACDINQLVRSAEKYFTLGVNTGYTFKNSITKSDTIDASVSTMIAGIGLNAGMSVPVGVDDFSPAFTLSANVNPNSFKSKQIKKDQDELSYRQDLYDIEIAIQNYDNTQISFDQELNNLLWEKENIKENFDLYKKDETDLEKYFKMGIVTESEYLTAKNNRQLYGVKSIINKLDFILYNNNIQSQFVDSN